ncbi:secretion protein HlyD [Sphingomonas oleivorans]|uniref:Membrane fusion protein (MFP) family protein n=1 Tax=Sphingomonas oleivorans TaxID=1735121 RepID=A0A2T5G085_9SPHN|nr:HlyD family type I secretion periplasmic adaptor subunit [Sphingomonas oleivorans]PTQ12355.1 secretion protein HlyD [Sphingomonas oleivorans]
MERPHIEDYAGEIRPRAVSAVLLWTILAFFLIFLIWAALTQLDRTVRGQGRVIPSSRLQILSNLEGGIVSDIVVRPGQNVRMGDLLIRLDRTQAGAEYASSRATSQALSAKIARLQGEIAGREPVYPIGQGNAADEQVAIERALHLARVAELASQQNAARARLDQAERAVAEAIATRAARNAARDAAIAERDLIAPLVERGIEPRLSLIQTSNAASVATSEAATAEAAVARAKAAVAEARAALAQTRLDWRARAAEELATTQAEEAARRRALPALENRLARTVVRAPLSGRINRVLVTTIGGSVKPGDPLVEMVPSGENLLVEALVNPKDIAFVRLNQPARVSITAYDQAIYGSLDGRVISISPDAVVNERTGESHYMLRIRTTKNSLVDRYGTPLPIGPGMIADVSLLGEKRSILSYILTPITRLAEHAFRE